MTDTDKQTDLLSAVNEHVLDQFAARKAILSYDQYVSLFEANPKRFTRGAYQYLTDMIEYYGPRKHGGNHGPAGYAVFDQKFNGGKGAVWGQAEVEFEIIRILRGFARVGMADKLILMHGPNGSAKTSIVRCLMKGLEHYSTLDEGALYHFNWIFPEERFTRETIGFSKDKQTPINPEMSYALLPEDRIAAKLGCPLRDNPFFLIPKEQRRRIITELRQTNEDFKDHQLSEYLMEGDLSPKNREIFDALLSAYNGDYAEVLRHVQVERYYISERYRIGAVTIEPQMSVDARIQQITADRSLSSLPPVLQNLSLYDAAGYLIQSNHGVVEFSDLLKRPVDAYKYLLGTCEKGTVSLDVYLVYLDLVLIGSSNDKYLEHFKQIPDFTSFKGRMELVRVPYLRDYEAEQLIYDSQLMLESGDKPVVPHLSDITAVWAVLTRLRRPKPENYTDELKDAMERLNPLEKARYYTHGETPDWMGMVQATELQAARGKMLHEFDNTPFYEGGFGASPREGKMILQNAAQAGDGCVGVRHVLGQMRRLIRDKSVYEWLQIEPDGDYHDQDKLLKYVEDYYIAKVDRELLVAMEMVEETQHLQLLERYVAQASAWIHKKRVTDPVSGEERPVDENFMKSVERIIAPNEEAKSVREDVVSRVGAFALENRDGESNGMDYGRIFPKMIARLEDHYFSRQQTRVEKLHQNLLKFMSDRKGELQSEEAKAVEGVLKRMERRFGYCPECVREVVGHLIRTKYAPVQAKQPDRAGAPDDEGTPDGEGI